MKQSFVTPVTTNVSSKTPSINVAAKVARCCIGGVMVRVLAIGPNVLGFKPGRGRWIFKGEKYQ
jgi:hypothetical protein